MESIAWIVIRKNVDSEKEWMDLTTIAVADWWSKRKAEEGEKISPIFCKANPVVRVEMIKIETIEEKE